MKRKKSLIVALAAILVFLMPLVSNAQIFTMSVEEENGRLSADGGVGWEPGPIADIDTDQYLPLGNGIWVLAASAGLYLLVKLKKSRRTKTLMLAALTLTLGTTQCHKPAETVSENGNEPTEVKTIYISLTCSNGFSPKADIDVNSGSYTWDDGDCVYVVYDGHLLSTKPLTVTPNSNPVFATINGSIEVTTGIGDNPEFTFYYVGSGVNFTHEEEEDATIFTFNIASQTSGEDVGEYMIGRTKAIQMGKDSEGTKYVADESVVFKPISSVLRLNTADFGECQMKATGAAALNMMEINLGTPNTLTCSHTADITFQSGADVSITVMPTTLGNENNDATVNFTGNGKEGSLTVKNGIKQGTIYAKILGNISTPYPVNGVETGMLPGEFSISSGVKVRFSKGNLQYQASENKWRFAENQWDYVGDATKGNVYENEVKCNNAKIASDYTGWIDLFGWGTTGYWDDRSQMIDKGEPKYQKNYQPYSTATSDIPGGSTISTINKYGYGPDYKDSQGNICQYNLSVDNHSDWGYNSIYAGSNPTNGWRTLSKDEWSYLFGLSDERTGKYKTGVTVNGIAKCVVLAPDVCLNGYSFKKDKAKYSSEEWETAEAAGLVCLPPAGSRNGTTISDVDVNGNYWSSTCSFAYAASYIKISSSSNTSETDNRYYGYSVRLVKVVTPSN